MKTAFDGRSKFEASHTFYNGAKDVVVERLRNKFEAPVQVQLLEQMKAQANADTFIGRKRLKR